MMIIGGFHRGDRTNEELAYPHAPINDGFRNFAVARPSYCRSGTGMYCSQLGFSFSPESFNLLRGFPRRWGPRGILIYMGA
jgi:hypothetical protein